MQICILFFNLHLSPPLPLARSRPGVEHFKAVCQYRLLRSYGCQPRRAPPAVLEWAAARLPAAMAVEVAYSVRGGIRGVYGGYETG